MTIGPIQAFVIAFPDNDMFEGRIAEELARLSDSGQIRIIDAVFVMREGDDVAVLSVSDLDDDQRAELRAAVGALVGLGVGGGGRRGRGRGSSGRRSTRTHRGRPRWWRRDWSTTCPTVPRRLVLAIEHLWAVPLRDAVRDAGGLVLAHRSLTIEDLVVLGLDLGDEVARGRRRGVTRTGALSGNHPTPLPGAATAARDRSSTSVDGAGGTVIDVTSVSSA